MLKDNNKQLIDKYINDKVQDNINILPIVGRLVNQILELINKEKEGFCHSIDLLTVNTITFVRTGYSNYHVHGIEIIYILIGICGLQIQGHRTVFRMEDDQLLPSLIYMKGLAINDGIKGVSRHEKV